MDLNIRQFNTSLFPAKTQIFSGMKATSAETFQQISHDLINMFAKINVQPLLKMNEVRTALTNVSKPLVPTPRAPVTIDPIVEDKSSCDLGNDEPHKIESHTNPTPVLMDLASKLGTQRPANSTTTSKGTISFSSKANLINGEVLSARMFDLYSAENLLSKTFQTDAFKSDTFFQGYPHNTTMEEAIMKLPNQIKSMYVARTTPTAIRNNIFQKQTDAAKDPEEKSDFRLNYQMINVVQVFNGYQVSVDGEFLLKNSIWMPLTIELYNKSIGKNLLCRLRPYENKAIGIIRDKALELPVYNEYFIINAQHAAVFGTNPITNEVRRVVAMSQVPTRPPPTPVKVESVKQIVVRPEYIQTNTVKSVPPKQIPPPKQQLPSTGQAIRTQTSGQVNFKGLINLPTPKKQNKPAQKPKPKPPGVK